MVLWFSGESLTETRRKTSLSAYPEQQKIRGTASDIILKHQKQRRVNIAKPKQSRKPRICRYLNQKSI
jgi:hypothetical protein